MEGELSTEELLRQMSLARQAVEQARQQAQLHVSAVLKGNMERLGAFQSETERQQTAGEEREAVAECFRLWASLPARNSRAKARLHRSVVHWQRRSVARCFVAWARVVRDSARREEAVLQSRLDAVKKQLGATPEAQASSSPGRRQPPVAVASAAGGSGLVVQLTQDARGEMQATAQDLKKSLQHHTARQAEANARHAEVGMRRVPNPGLLMRVPTRLKQSAPAVVVMLCRRPRVRWKQSSSRLALTSRQRVPRSHIYRGSEVIWSLVPQGECASRTTAGGIALRRSHFVLPRGVEQLGLLLSDTR